LDFAPEMESGNLAGAREKLKHAAVSPALRVQNFEGSSDFWMNLSFAVAVGRHENLRLPFSERSRIPSFPVCYNFSESIRIRPALIGIFYKSHTASLQKK
jgi:hypothetical protein